MKEKNNNKKDFCYISCSSYGDFSSYGNISDLCVLYAFIAYKLLKNGIEVKYLISSLCNANDLYNVLNKEMK